MNSAQSARPVRRRLRAAALLATASAAALSLAACSGSGSGSGGTKGMSKGSGGSQQDSGSSDDGTVGGGEVSKEDDGDRGDDRAVPAGSSKPGGQGKRSGASCVAADTSLKIAETGHTTRTITLTNTGKSACVAYGFPQVSFDPELDGSASRVKDSEPDKPVRLAPGESAHATLIPVYGESDRASDSSTVVVDLESAAGGEGKPRTLRHAITVFDPKVTAWQPTEKAAERAAKSAPTG